MEADEKRKIRGGEEFDHLFPPPTKEDKTIKGSASVEDTMALIQQTVPQTLWHTEKIAKKLKGKTLEETCRNIWHFVYQHIQYKRDEDGVEQVRSPRRTWWERDSGVDCDCYTEFISSILLNLNILHKARITKYPKKNPQVARWQHVYPIVPKAGRWHRDMSERNDYIVIDCVKNDFDDEQPYLECKDYDMRLDYLDGIENDPQEENFEMVEHDSVDLSDLASIYDEEEMGNLFKKIGGAVKKAATTVKTATKAVASNVKTATKVVASQVKETAKKVGDKAGEGIRFINRYANPATILLRNGFLLAMKINLLNVGGRLRYAYLSDAQAQAKGININELNKLRSVKDRAETVYWQAGGKKENLKKAILHGKGNKDKKVPLSGLNGINDNVYADYDEYNIIHSDNMEGLGELVSGTAIVAATSAVAAIAAALKQVKGLFNNGGSEEQSFQSETDNAGSAATAPSTIPEDEDAFTYEETSQGQSASPASSFLPNPSSLLTAARSLMPAVTQKITQSFAPAFVAPQQTQSEEQTYNETTQTSSNETAQDNSSSVQDTQRALSNESASGRSLPVPTEDRAKSTALQTQNNAPQAEGFIQKTTTWVKQNPGKSLLVAGGVITGGFLLVKVLQGGGSKTTHGTNGLSGLPRNKKRKKQRQKQKYKLYRSKNKRTNVKPQNLL